MMVFLSVALGWLRHWLARLCAFLDLPPIEERAGSMAPCARERPQRAQAGKILEFRPRPSGEPRAGRPIVPQRALLVQTARYYDDS